jgi:hypothetical protein
MEMWPLRGMWSKAFQSMKMFQAATSEIWDGLVFGVGGEWV